MLSTRQELRLNSFIASTRLVVRFAWLFVAYLSLWLSVSLSRSLCRACRAFAWLLRLRLHASLTVNSRQPEHTFSHSLTFNTAPARLPPPPCPPLPCPPLAVRAYIFVNTYVYGLAALLNSIGFHPICRICCLVRFFHFACSSFFCWLPYIPNSLPHAVCLSLSLSVSRSLTLFLCIIRTLTFWLALTTHFCL